MKNNNDKLLTKQKHLNCYMTGKKIQEDLTKTIDNFLFNELFSDFIL